METKGQKFFFYLGFITAVYLFVAGLVDVSFRAVVPFVRDVRAMVTE